MNIPRRSRRSVVGSDGGQRDVITMFNMLATISCVMGLISLGKIDSAPPECDDRKFHTVKGMVALA
jgi:hypothetical protein